MSDVVSKDLIEKLTEEIISKPDTYEDKDFFSKQYRIILKGDEDEDKVVEMTNIYATAAFNIVVHRFTELDLYHSNKEGANEIAYAFMHFLKEDIEQIFRGTHEHSLYLVKGHDLDHVPLFELPFLCSLNLIFTHRKDKVTFKDISIDYGVEIMKRSDDTFFVLNQDEGKGITLN